jgi:hypothetical protein
MSRRLGISAGRDDRKILTVPGAWPPAGRSDGGSGTVYRLRSSRAHQTSPNLGAGLALWPNVLRAFGRPRSGRAYRGGALLEGRAGIGDAAGQLAGRLVPLPGGLGGVEGGMLGALTLTGTAPTAAAAAVIVYRVAGYWAVGAIGTALAAAFARREPGGVKLGASTPRLGRDRKLGVQRPGPPE